MFVYSFADEIERYIRCIGNREDGGLIMITMNFFVLLRNFV